MTVHIHVLPGAVVNVYDGPPAATEPKSAPAESQTGAGTPSSAKANPVEGLEAYAWCGAKGWVKVVGNSEGQFEAFDPVDSGSSCEPILSLHNWGWLLLLRQDENALLLPVLKAQVGDEGITVLDPDDTRRFEDGITVEEAISTYNAIGTVLIPALSDRDGAEVKNDTDDAGDGDDDADDEPKSTEGAAGPTATTEDDEGLTSGAAGEDPAEASSPGDATAGTPVAAETVAGTSTVDLTGHDLIVQGAGDSSSAASTPDQQAQDVALEASNGAAVVDAGNAGAAEDLATDSPSGKDVGAEGSDKAVDETKNDQGGADQG